MNALSYRLSKTDLKLIEKITALNTTNPDYWSFKGRAKRTGSHALFQYPAMMVPQMQGVLIRALLDVNPDVHTILDPFVGVGTTLGESMLQGLNFIGYDINPLAILACKVKSQPLYLTSLQKKIEQTTNNIKHDCSEEIDVYFNGIDKWFLKSVQIDLCKIRRAIRIEESLWARRFFWLTLCSVVRAVCNSRSSTYKLHIKAKDKILSQDVIHLFQKELIENFKNLKKFLSQLQDKSFVCNGCYLGQVSLKLCDVKIQNNSKKVDAIISSPPYGDNKTTVPYGQFSYLPLQWIDLPDIEKSLTPYCIQGQSIIDNLSLGGKLTEWRVKKEGVCEKSSTLAETVKLIESRRQKEIRKIIVFFDDLDKSLDKIVGQLKNNGYMIWTVGNRSVAGTEIKLNEILKQLLQQKGCSFIYELERIIPSKRMAPKNKSSVTMTREFVLIMKKL